MPRSVTRARIRTHAHLHSTPLCHDVTYLWLLALLDWVLLRGSTAPLPSRLGERRLLLAETDGPEMVVTIVCVRGIRCTLCRGRMAYSSLCCFLGVGLSGGRGRRAAIAGSAHRHQGDPYISLPWMKGESPFQMKAPQCRQRAAERSIIALSRSMSFIAEGAMILLNRTTAFQIEVRLYIS